MSYAALEIGTGMTKLYSPDGLYLEKKISISSSSFQDTLASMIAESKKYGVSEFIPVATFALRNATNGEEICEQLSHKLGIPKIRILSGEEESLMGFSSASLISGIGNETLLAADMGSGSLQFATYDNDGVFHHISKELGTNSAHKIESVPSILGDLPASFIGKEVVGIGFFALVGMGLNSVGLGKLDKDLITFSAEDVSKILSSDDATLEIFTSKSNIWKDSATASLTLVYTIMKVAGLEQITSSLDKKLVGIGPAIIKEYLEQHP